MSSKLNLEEIVDEVIHNADVAARIKSSCQDKPIAEVYITIKSTIINMCKGNDKLTNDSKLAISALNGVTNSNTSIREDLKTSLSFINKYMGEFKC